MAREFGLTPALTGLVGSAIMIGTIFGSLIGGWLTDKIGRYQVFMADMLFFVVAAIAAGLAPNVWVLIGARFVMGPGRHRPAGRDGVSRGILEVQRPRQQGSRLAAWCPMWYVASSACFLLIFGLYFLLPAEHAGWLWRASLIFGAVPALVIILFRNRFMNESPLGREPG